MIGSIYFESEKEENEIKISSILNDSVLLIKDGFIEDIYRRKDISKNGILEDYKYFDSSFCPDPFLFNIRNILILISHVIYNDKNFFSISIR